MPAIAGRAKHHDAPGSSVHRNLNASQTSVSIDDSSVSMRHETPEKVGLDIDTGAVPQNSELPSHGCASHRGADPIESELKEALEAWRRQPDAAVLRRALLDLLLRLER